MSNQIPISLAMTKQVITLNPLDTFDKAKLLFEENNFHHLPVVDENQKVLGMISKTDYHSLCDRFTLFSEALGNEINNSYFSSLLAREVMHVAPVSLSPTSSIDEAVAIFEKNLFHAVPVVDSENVLVGILSSLDVLKYLHKALNNKNMSTDFVGSGSKKELIG